MPLNPNQKFQLPFYFVLLPDLHLAQFAFWPKAKKTATPTTRNHQYTHSHHRTDVIIMTVTVSGHYYFIVFFPHPFALNACIFIAVSIIGGARRWFKINNPATTPSAPPQPPRGVIVVFAADGGVKNEQPQNQSYYCRILFDNEKWSGLWNIFEIEALIKIRTTSHMINKTLENYNQTWSIN